jgi:hypothetical protein
MKRTIASVLGALGLAALVATSTPWREYLDGYGARALPW